MRTTLIVLTLAITGALVLLPCENTASAQIVMKNSATGGPANATTTGTQHAYDTTNFVLGAASGLRSPAAGTGHLPTKAALDPTSVGSGGAGAAPGFTIQWWYKPAAATTFGYHWSDRSWGSFRCFQNGAAGVGEVIIRGPLTDVKTTGSVLTSMVNAKGWIHLAVTVDTKAAKTTWYVNGKLNNSGATGTITGKGTAFVCFGDTGSSSGYQGNQDDFRIYNWARTAADIAADYNMVATGTGPSGSPNVPDLGYYRCEVPFACKAPATLSVGTSGAIDLSKGPATDIFQIAASLGNTSVLRFGTNAVNLNLDNVFVYSVLYGPPIFNGYAGTLVAGAGQGKFSPPALAALIGVDVYHAAIAFGKAGVTDCTNTVMTGLTK